MNEDDWRTDSAALEEPVERIVQSEPVHAVPEYPAPRKKIGRTLLTIVGTMLLFSLVVFLLLFLRQQASKSDNNQDMSSVKVQEIDVSSISADTNAIEFSDGDRVVVNGKLQANEALILVPSVEPNEAVLGQIYLDKDTGQLRYYNGALYLNIAVDTGKTCEKGSEECGFLTSNDITGYITQGDAASLIQSAVGAIDTGPSLPQDLDVTATPQFAGLKFKNGSGGTVTLQSSASSGAVTFTLPIADGTSSQCLTTDGAGQLSFSSCSTGSGTAFVQGGNSFGATATLGTNDSNPLVFRTNSVTQATLAVGGALTLQNSVDSTSALNVLSSTSATVFNVDTTNGRVGIGTATPQTKLSVVNTSLVAQTAFKVNQENTAQYIAEFRSNDTNVFTLGGTGAALFQNTSDMVDAFRVNDDSGTAVLAVNNTWGTLGAVGIGTNGPTAKLSVIGIGNATGDALRVSNSTSTGNIAIFADDTTTVATIANGGAVKLQNSVNSSTAFQIQNAAGSNFVTVDTTDTNYANITLGGTGINYSTLTFNQGASNVWGIGSDDVDLGGTNGFFVYNYAAAQTPFALTTGGAAIFKNSTNSSTAYQIQNAAGAQLFNVDTSNNVITMNGNTSAELQSWVTNGTSLSSAVKAHGTVTAGGYIYAIGGVESVAHTNTVRYAPINANGSIGSWSTTTALPATRSYSAVVAHGGFIYVIGGYDNAENVTSSVYYARANSDGTLSAWQSSDNKLNTSVGAAGTLVANGYIYLVGGAIGRSGVLTGAGQPTGAQTAVQYARINSDGTIDPFTSTTGSSLLPATRVGGRAITANGYMYYTGGQDASLTAQTSIYHVKLNIDGSLDSGGWTTSGCSLNAARTYHGITTLNGYLYIFGGGSDASTGSTSAQYATLNSNGTLTCSGGVLTSTTNSMASSAVNFGFAAANGYMYAVGGTGLSAIQYASGPRVYIASSLDLVSFTGENLATGGSGGTLTVGETRVVGTLQVSDEASFLQGVRVGGNLHVAGQATFRNNVDSSTALVIQNSAGSSILSFDTDNNTVQPGFSSTLTLTSRNTNSITYLSHDIAQSMSIAVGSDKLPIIAALDQTDSKIVVAKCLDNECSSYSTKGGLGTGVINGSFNVSMTTGSQDGLPIIAYRVGDGVDLYVLHCGNTTCTSGNVDRALHTSGQVGAYPTIIMGVDGMPFIAYKHTGNNDLYTIHCGDPTCDPGASGFVGPTLVSGSSSSVGSYNSVAIGNCADGTYGCPVISHFRADGGGDDLQVTLCANIACSAVTSDTTISTTGTGGGITSIVMMADGKPFVSITNGSSQLMGIRCVDIGCTSVSSNSVLDGGMSGAAGIYSVLGENSYPLIAYKSSVVADLKLRQCTNAYCTTATTTTIDLGGSGEGQYPTIAMGDDGFPLVSWSASSSNTTINVTHCISQSCASTSATVPTGGVTLGSQYLRFGGINVDTINSGVSSARLRLLSDGKFMANSLIADDDGTVTIQSNSTTAFKLTNVDTAVNVLIMDAANGRLGINTTAPANKLSVNGLTTADSTAQVAISTGLFTNKGLVVQGAGLQTANLTEWQNSSGTIMASIGATGAALFKNSSNSTTAFSVQNSTGSAIFNVDTTNGKVGTPDTATASTNSNAFVLQSGNASGTTSNSGNVTIDVGTATGTVGNISIGTTNALTVTIGRSSGTLTVESDSTFNGKLTIASHVLSANESGSTTVAAGAAACTTPTVTISGNDTAGQISVTTGTGCAAGGVLATATFASAYGSAPRVIFTASDVDAASLALYVGTVNTTTFELSTTTTPVDSTGYLINYFVIE